jgi:uncharacterized membrane protein
VTARLRLSALWQHLKGSLWVLPSLFVVSALALGTALSQLETVEGTFLEGVVFGGTASGARDVLAIIAGSMITVIGLSFSLTVVALQMASAQFSPRVLRAFLEDRGNQIVISVLLATFAYSLAVIRVIRDEDSPQGEFLPRIAVTVGIVFTLLAVMALVYFIHNLTQELRGDTIMTGIVAAALATIERMHPDPAGGARDERELPLPAGKVRRVQAARSGYLQAVRLDGLARAAHELDAVVRLRPTVGAQVAEGTTLAWMWSRDGRPAERDVLERWGRAVHAHVHLGRERTMQQDVAFGLRQLVDIAVKALSPGVNDPATAVDALGHLARVLSLLAVRELGDGAGADDEGTTRAIVPSPRLDDYLALACDQPRRYGARDPAVMVALLDLLADVAELVCSDDERAVVSRECTRTLEVARRELDATDVLRVEAAADLVQRVLAARGRPYPPVAG